MTTRSTATTTSTRAPPEGASDSIVEMTLVESTDEEQQQSEPTNNNMAITTSAAAAVAVAATATTFSSSSSPPPSLLSATPPYETAVARQSQPYFYWKERNWNCGMLLLIAMAATGWSLGLATLRKDMNNDGDLSSRDSSGSSSAGNNSSSPLSLLETIRARGVLSCGVVGSGANATTGLLLEVDLCRAVSAAVFGDSAEDEALQMVWINAVEDGWKGLHQQSLSIDLLLGVRPTLDRDVYLPVIQTGVEFSTPYLYDGITWNGVPDFMACAEQGSREGSLCSQLRVCTLEETLERLGADSSSSSISWLPRESMLVFRTLVELRPSFPSLCQVVLGRQSQSSLANLQPPHDNRLFMTLYDGPFVQSSVWISREPRAVATRQGDPRWTDFVEAVLQALWYAEREGITQATAHDRMGVVEPPDALFGPQFTHMFRHAVAAGGHYGELSRGQFSREATMNRLNRGTEPLLWSFPWGDRNVVGPPVEERSPTIRAIRERGFLNCGFAEYRGFGEFVPDARTYRGMDSDLCRAVAAALLDGVENVVWSDLEFATRWETLQSERVDVLAMVTTWNLARDVQEPSVGTGFTFTDAYTFVGSSFGGLPQYVQCADQLDVVSPQCQDLRVCVIHGSSLVSNLAELLGNDFYLVEVENFGDSVMSLQEGRCNTIFTLTLNADEQNVRAQGYTGEEYVVGDRVLALEPFSMVTRQDDPVWSDFVRWILWALVYAEEQGITQAVADQMPRTHAFGPFRVDAFYHAVNAVGNYGEIYERNFGHYLRRNVLHQLNNNTGARIYSIPGFDKLA